ncbi:MAG: uroporphyrinogen decarboxylase [Bacteroidetes bacterium]|nr:MAG: uroporphyrinogen decarboxylase [Bacteroidota bacterium]
MELLGVSITEWVGYVAMVLLLISFMMKDVRKLRIINSFACAFFVAYGFMLSTSWPIIISNSAIFGVNFYYLFVKKN